MPALFRNTILYVFVGFLPVAVNFILAPIYASYLIPAQYALVGLATLFQAFLTFFMSWSLDGAFSRLYFDYEKEGDEKYKFLSSLLIAVIILSGIVTVILYFSGESIFHFIFSNREFTFKGLGSWTTLTTFCNVIYLLFVLLFRNQEKVYSFIRLNIAFFLVPVIGTLTGLIFLKGGARGAIIGRALGSLAVVLPLVIYFFYRHKPVVSLRFLRPAFRYALPLIPYQLMFAGFSNLDRIFLEKRFTAHDFGVYNFAIMISGVIPVFLNAYANATNPRIYRELSDEQNHGKVKLFNYIGIFAATGIICAGMAFVVPVMRIVINSNYKDSYVYVGALFLTFLPYVHYLVYALPLFYSGKTRPFPVISFIALLTGILFNYIFIPIWGIWAVCLSLYVIRGVQMFAAYLFLRNYRFHSLSYVQQPKPLAGSALIIGGYGMALLLRLIQPGIPVDFVNAVPLLIFICLAFTIYRKEFSLVRGQLLSVTRGVLFKKVNS